MAKKKTKGAPATSKPSHDNGLGAALNKSIAATTKRSEKKTKKK